MAVLMFIIGLVLGSFFLVVGLRLPKNEDILVTRSHCDHCQKELKWYNLIPIFSYIFQKGKCTFCHQKISPLNLIIELTCGTLFLIGFIYYGISYKYYIYLIIISLMLLIFITDFIYMIILDSPLVIGSLSVIVLKWIFLGPKFVFSSILAGLVCFIIMIAIQKFGEYLFEREALGGGDIKFSFIIGLILELPLGVAALVLANFLALPYSVVSLYLNENNEVPFGPFLAGSLLIVYLFSDKFLNFINYFF
ncbi:MAG: prepilin peptidase [Firmicutes bacterium]|nr:prepilin peptidase [Bacillota bacterium]